MARKKDTKRKINRAKGVFARSGKLSITVPREGYPGMSDTISTGLEDTPDNVRLAVEKRNHLLAGRKNGTSMNVNITVAEICDLFVAEKKRGIVGTTESGYVYCVKRAKEYFGDKKVTSLSKTDVEKMLDALLLKGLALNTVKDTKRRFAAAVDLAVKAGIISSNPVKEADWNKRLIAECTPDENVDDTFFSTEEWKFFIGELKKSPDKKYSEEYHDIYYCMFYFCLRRSELLGLKWSNIDFANKTLSIVSTVTKGIDGVSRKNHTKSECSKDYFTLTDKMVNFFLNIRKRQNDNRKVFGKDYYESDYIFTHTDGTLYYPDTISKEFKKIISKYPDKLPQNITLHGLRGSGISSLVENNSADPKTVQNWARHKDVETTLTYYAKVKNKKSKMAISDIMDGIVD